MRLHQVYAKLFKRVCFELRDLFVHERAFFARCVALARIVRAAPARFFPAHGASPANRCSSERLPLERLHDSHAATWFQCRSDPAPWAMTWSIWKRLLGRAVPHKTLVRARVSP